MNLAWASPKKNTDHTIRYPGGGGVRSNMKKVCRHKNRIKSLLKTWAEQKSLLTELMKNMMTQNKPANSDVGLQTRKILRRNLLFLFFNET